jgi:beta-1,4-mannosyltransferase
MLLDRVLNHWHLMELTLLNQFMRRWEDSNEQLSALKTTFMTTTEYGTVDVTLITRRLTTDGVVYRQGRPLFLISSTSWTIDEDFSILLRALGELEKKLKSSEHHFPRILCIITGKGPMKDHYSKEIQRRSWNYCHFITTWLSSEDYPKALACADLGISLHTSSSGLDLPMKVLDMYGTGLPVCAAKYECISELVEEGVTGWTFTNHLELCDHLMRVVMDFPENSLLGKMRRRIVSRYHSCRWRDCWKEVMIPLLTKQV